MSGEDVHIAVAHKKGGRAVCTDLVHQRIEPGGVRLGGHAGPAAAHGIKAAGAEIVGDDLAAQRVGLVGEHCALNTLCPQFVQKLRDAGAEYGAKTGRPRRVGPIDLVATRYGVEVQGATTIALTKLDILSYMDKIPVCAHYELDGQQTDEFPFPVCLQDAKPVIEYVDGWKCDISKVRSWDELPESARNYVEYVERAIGCHIGYVSVGAERDSLIIR